MYQIINLIINDSLMEIEDIKQKKSFFITLEDRTHIEKLVKEKKSCAKIAALTGIARSTLRAELKRCPKGQYNANQAHKHHLDIWIARRERMLKSFSDQELNFIKLRIEQGAPKTTIRKELGCSFFRLEKFFAENYPDHKGGALYNMDLRLSNIEQQLEILFDLVKDKLGV